MTQRLAAQGSTKGSKWDDESDHDNVTKIYIRCDSGGIQSISFDYVKNGKPNGSFHGKSYKGYTQTFEVNHLQNEHLQSFEAYYTECDGIQALQFRTNLRMSELMGNNNDKGLKFTLALEVKSIIGFHGSAQSSKLCSHGAYFTWITPTRMEAKGGKGGKDWDDGVDNQGVTKIHVRAGREGIQNIKFEYVDKDGHLKDGPIHGSTYGRGSPHLFEIKHVEKEYLVSVEGYYDDGVIHALQFKTNIKTSELIGLHRGCKKFRLSASGMKIIGFHGFAENNLNSLGAYFIKLTPSKLECKGTMEGIYWDDGAFEGIRQVNLFYGNGSITYFRFNYDNDGKLEKRDHGQEDVYNGEEGEFVVDYPNEFITSVEGTYRHDYKWISSLTFKTSKGRTSQKFGGVSGADEVEFVLESKGCAVVGFHGWTDSYLIAFAGLGAYFCPMPPPPAAEKLEAKGGDGGAPWDDGADFEGVRKIYIGLGEVGIASIKFLYQNDTQEFELEYPCEYLISVEGSYDVVPGSDDSEVMLMLKFTTNKRTSPCFGLDDDSSFMLYKEGHKIVGFHGQARNMLNQIGAHVLPITYP